MDLVELVDEALGAAGLQSGGAGAYVFLDDIHNVPEWEQRLDELARARPSVRITGITGLVPRANTDVAPEMRSLGMTREKGRGRSP